MAISTTKADEHANHALANKEDKRKRERVERQPRDEQGRWIAAGANVQWNAMNQVWSGTVMEIRDGKAVVRVHQDNGNSFLTTLEPATLTVTTSKARLDTISKEFADPENDFKAFLDKTDGVGEARITRQDGYTLEVEKDDDNTFTYQIFSPDGVSLGRYSKMAENDLDDMVEEDKLKNSTDPSKEQTFDVVRVSRDSETAIIKRDDGYGLVSLSTGQDVSNGVKEFAPLVASGSWRRVASDEKDELVSKITAAADIVVQGTEKTKTYRVPEAVRNEIATALASATDVSPEDHKIATTLATNDTVSLAEIDWINSFFADNSTPQQLRGGYRGQKWASKVVNTQEDDADSIKKYEFGESLDYYAIGDDPMTTVVHRLIAVNPETGIVLNWSDGEFSEFTETADAIDEPLIVPVDSESAEALAMWIDGDNEMVFDLMDVDPDERNLFFVAESEMDFEHLDRLSTVVADATGYSPAERSVDAQRQQRIGGRFRDQGGSVPEPGKKLHSAAKAKLSNEDVEIDDDPKVTIHNWIAKASPSPIVSAAEDDAEPTEETASEGEPDILYFAIVDPVDKNAVLNVVAITKAENGDAQAWKRENAEWVEAPNLLGDLEGTTPPPVVELDVPEPAKNILAQIDEHDSQSKKEEEEPAPVAASGVSDKERDKAAEKGYALPDGSYPIRNEKDLKNAVQAFGRAKDSDKAKVKKHIKKRARALNRKDLIPDNWSEASTDEMLDQTPLFGDYGEVIIAAGVPGVADAPSDFRSVRRLKNYWKYGAGAAKINWANPNGNLTRCHRHLTKYIGSADAWGYCQNLHKELFGESNAERDN